MLSNLVFSVASHRIFSSTSHCSRCFSNSAPKLTNLKTVSPNPQPIVKHFESKGDIILYTYENQRRFTAINVAGLLCYLYCANLSYYAIKKMYDDDDEYWLEGKTRWFEEYNLNKKQMKWTIAAASAFIGVAVLSFSWLHTMRSVKHLILDKDGKHLTIVTYLPFSKNRFIKVPIVNVSCSQNRYTAKQKLELSVKRKFPKFVLDLKGDFKNPNLFDKTLGLMK